MSRLNRHEVDFSTGSNRKEQRRKISRGKQAGNYNMIQVKALFT